MGRNKNYVFILIANSYSAQMFPSHTPVLTLDSLVVDGGVVNGTVVLPTGVVEADCNVVAISSVVNPVASVVGFVVVFA